MFEARIYKPAKNAMQSGRAKTDLWVLEYESEAEKRPEPVMGWTSAGDTLGQVRLKFPTAEAAVQYAQAHGIAFTLSQGHERKIKPRNYVDNFKYVPPDKKKSKNA